MAYPGTYRYTREHEWIDAGAGKVGITDYAQRPWETLSSWTCRRLGQRSRKARSLEA